MAIESKGLFRRVIAVVWALALMISSVPLAQLVPLTDLVPKLANSRTLVLGPFLLLVYISLSIYVWAVATKKTRAAKISLGSYVCLLTLLVGTISVGWWVLMIARGEELLGAHAGSLLTLLLLVLVPLGGVGTQLLNFWVLAQGYFALLDIDECVKVTCPECSRRLKGATQEMIGDTGVCPKCKAEFVIQV